jgi:hypothetical protein
MPPVLRKRKDSGVGSGVGSSKRNDAGRVPPPDWYSANICGEPIIVFQEQSPTVSNKEKTTKARTEVKRALTHPETLQVKQSSDGE